MLLASLVEPAFGLIFWMTLSFGIVFFLLAKFAWKPILKALHEREQSIEDAIGEARKAREEVAAMKAGNEDLLKEARAERELMLKEARDIRDKEIADAKGRAKAEADAILARAREDIRNEKNAAITEMKNQVGELSIVVAERILRDKLGDKAAQQTLLDKVMKESDIHLS
ncbi:MAG: F0F1 ATP synthase subunit B [Flavobacteriales bacterium]|jgi:F-type H+-transporting ATPase subunit b|nr:F0F1 ATP synthase subunit B [Flavobacteriales bacterium]MBK6894900.1 F0F1 ATP synthase subunit B [Flavobacteriales bacterium]MBK7247331.1 F0F1 ATP synthase subunit B [Flavobacteriales bacterium]MBK9599535.1 F0F1 ATP synthase subunit B [Flavobacteriales bacterium]QQS71675.1 MAG: F0F1 ATP synthase subunit B [Flavobacteriales bacterium]